MTTHEASTAQDTKPPVPLPWQTPSLRAIPASEAQMPVGKASPGGDGISQS